MKCLFGHEKLTCVAVNHIYIQTVFPDESVSDKMNSTVATMKCPRCGKLKTSTLKSAGHLTTEQLNEGVLA